MNVGIKIVSESTVKLGFLFFLKLWVSNSIEKNVYTSLGFTFRDTIEMDMDRRKRLKISGPEKQLLLDDNFIEKAKNKIGISGGKRKTRKNKKSKSRKTKRNKSKSRKRKTRKLKRN